MKRTISLPITMAAVTALALLSVAALSAPEARTAPPKKHHVRVVGDRYSQKETSGGTVMTLQGNVKFASEDATLQTGLATWNERTQIANSPGRLRVEDSRNTIIGNKGVAYYRTRDARIEDEVVITVKPKPGGANAPEGTVRREFRDPAVITCARVDYNWRNKIAVVPGAVTVKQKDRTVTADRARYDANTETVVLTGNIRAVDAKGREARGTEATIILRAGEEEIIVRGPFSATFELEDEDTSSTTNGSAPAPVSPTEPAPDNTPATRPQPQ